MQKLIWRNSNGDEIDLTKSPYGITHWEGFSNTPVNIQSQQVPFKDGGVFLDALLTQRDLSVTLAIQDNNDLVKRYQYRRELNHILNPKLGEGYLIYINDFISKRIKCVPQIPLFPTHNSNDKGTPKGELVWVACEPYWEDLEETMVFFRSFLRNEIVNNGDVDCGIKLTLYPSPSTTNPILSNFTQNKHIKLNGEFLKEININTNVGEKSVNSSDMKWSFDNFGSNINAIAYSEELNLLVAVGSYDLIMTSNNGTDWKFNSHIISENPYLLKINDIIYSKELEMFIGCGIDDSNSSYSLIITSDDGINWELNYIEISGLTGVELKKIIYSKKLELFVAISESRGGVIITSSDGINWSKSNLPSGYSLDIQEVVYSEDKEIFIAVADRYLLKSIDGINWELVTSEESSAYSFMHIAYSEDKGVFVTTGSLLRVSTDGINWETLEEFDANTLGLVTYQPLLGKFLIQIKSQTSSLYYKMLTSADSVTWIEENTSNLKINSIVFYKKYGFFISVGANSLPCISNDGIHYKSNNVIDTNIDFISVIYSNKLDTYLILSNSSTVFITKDGKEFQSSSLGNNSPICATYSEFLGLFVVVCNFGYLYVSDDGLHWREINLNAPGLIYFAAIVYSEELRLFVLTDQQSVWTSIDGINWTGPNENVLAFVNKIIYCNKLNCFIGLGGNAIYKSTDGITWEIINSSLSITSPHWSDAIWIDDLELIVASASNKIYISSDGMAWEIIDDYGGFSGITYNKKLHLIVACRNTLILTSTNGREWNSTNTEVCPVLTGIGTSEKSLDFCCVGSKAQILNSYLLKSENIINKLSSDSDMNLLLKIGNNELLLSCDLGEVNGILSYRQKYIGV